MRKTLLVEVLDETPGHGREAASRQTGESGEPADARVGQLDGQAPHRPLRGAERPATARARGHSAPAVPHAAEDDVARTPGARITPARAPAGSRRRGRGSRRPRALPVAASRPGSRARPSPG